jgi:DNA-damage-inducible protein J
MYPQTITEIIMHASSIKTRVSDELKLNATDVLNHCGLTVSAAIRLFLEQVVQTQGLPFQVKAAPSKKMLKALSEASDIENSMKIKHTSIENMLNELNSDEK